MYYSHLDIKDFEEIPEPDRFSGRFSDLFLESYPSLFPETYTQELHDFFRFLIHPYRRCFDTPAASPKNEEIEAAIKNKGQKGCCTFMREQDRKFRIQPVAEWMFETHRLWQKHYYTSDIRRTMLMFDVDGHKAHQSRAMTEAAQRIIEAGMLSVMGAAPCFVGSGRGENGYLKVNIAGYTPEQANEVYDDLQDAIRLLLVQRGSLADFEIKGTITWMDDRGKLHAGRYGKLPMCSPDWSYAWFDDFRRSRTVTIPELKKLIENIKAKITDEDVRRHDAAVHAAVLAHYLPLEKDHEWKLNRDVGNAWQDDCIRHRGRPWVARRALPDDVIEKLWPNYCPAIEEADTGYSASTVIHEADEFQVPAIPLEHQVFFDLEAGVQRATDKKKEKGRHERSRAEGGEGCGQPRRRAGFLQAPTRRPAGVHPVLEAGADAGRSPGLHQAERPLHWRLAAERISQEGQGQGHLEENRQDLRPEQVQHEDGGCGEAAILGGGERQEVRHLGEEEVSDRDHGRQTVRRRGW